MLTGFNTDVRHKGKVYHVQTEDKGISNPVIETLIYLGGEIIEARRTSYKDLLETQGFQPQLIYRLMEQQHKMAIADIREGRFDTDFLPDQPPTAPTKSLDDVILEYLRAQSQQQEALQLRYDRERTFQEGASVELPLWVMTETSGQPVVGAHVIVRVISTVQPIRTLWEGHTDEQGQVTARFQIPEFPDGLGALLIQAFYRDQAVEEKQLLMKSPVRSPSKRKSAEVG
jgi:hypothetical protein